MVVFFFGVYQAVERFERHQPALLQKDIPAVRTVVYAVKEIDHAVNALILHIPNVAQIRPVARSGGKNERNLPVPLNLAAQLQKLVCRIGNLVARTVEFRRVIYQPRHARRPAEAVVMPIDLFGLVTVHKPIVNGFAVDLALQHVVDRL